MIALQRRKRVPSERTQPQFQCGQFVTVPIAISESQQVYIAGSEWGPDNRLLKSNGWVYRLIAVPLGGFPISPAGTVWPSGTRFQATEAELLSWRTS